MKTQTLTGAWQFRQVGAPEWSPATVPGGVHTDLLALGRIPDPFVGDNEKRVAWVAEADWQYRYSFTVAPDLQTQKHIWLVCDGLDTLAALHLNGHDLGATNNMFRQYRWDVTDQLQAGENELLINFASPVQFITRHQAERPMAGVYHAIAGGPYLRKAPSQFGWDWGPKLPPIGIWKEIRLEAGPGPRFDEVHLRQLHENGAVTISAGITVTGAAGQSLTAHLTVTSPTGEVSTVETRVNVDQAQLATIVADPQLWWPNGFGGQPLYHVRISLCEGDLVVAERLYRLGLRTIELRQEPDEWGRSFQFVVNGVPIFAKGANWIPADSFPTRLTREGLEALIQSSVAAHQNMLRVWGGGFYEDERFYDLCDEYGILVWQDFIFSCHIYPLNDPEFVDNVRVEVEENMRRLRHRTSLALWCGNNEMEEGWVHWGWDRPENQDLKTAYDQFFHHTLARWSHTLDPDTPYWPSSPSSDTPFQNPRGQAQGDAHYWEVWHGRKPFTAYRTQYPRFMSEFGFQALPPLATIKTFAEKADWNMTSYIMEQHQKNDSGNSLMVGQMLDTFRLPKDFASLVYLSLVLQAEGIRYGVEHWRRQRDRVGGTLYWQANDCWPVASWSSLDYFGRWKALHYAARRFYAPLLLSIEDEPPAQNVFVTNDQVEAWQGELHWSLETLSGTEIAAGTETINAAPLVTTPIKNFDFAEHVDDDRRRDLVFVAELWSTKGCQARQTAYFAPTKHLLLTDPGLIASCQVADGQLTITLHGQALARMVELALDGVDVVFSDNYFDLPAGRALTITCPLPAGWTIAEAEAALQIRSIYDSY